MAEKHWNNSHSTLWLQGCESRLLRLFWPLWWFMKLKRCLVLWSMWQPWRYDPQTCDSQKRLGFVIAIAWVTEYSNPASVWSQFGVWHCCWSTLQAPLQTTVQETKQPHHSNILAEHSVMALKHFSSGATNRWCLLPIQTFVFTSEVAHVIVAAELVCVIDVLTSWLGRASLEGEVNKSVPGRTVLRITMEMMKQ